MIVRVQFAFSLVLLLLTYCGDLGSPVALATLHFPFSSTWKSPCPPFRVTMNIPTGGTKHMMDTPYMATIVAVFEHNDTILTLFSQAYNP